MRCRPGDLAVLISARDVPENLNKILEVVYQDEDGWMCRSRYPMLNTMGVLEPLGAMGWVPDRCLRPIRPKEKKTMISLAFGPRAKKALQALYDRSSDEDKEHIRQGIRAVKAEQERLSLLVGIQRANEDVVDRHAHDEPVS